MAGSQSHWEYLGLPALVLSPLSLLYAAGWYSYSLPFKFGWKKSAKPHDKIICVGSLLAGGAGKTPFTLHLTDVLTNAGLKVAISISGYRSQHRKGATLAPDGPLDAAEWGDETALFRWMRPGHPIVVGKDRVEAARIIHEKFPDHVMLMDDGFQHLELEKDLTIVLDPPNLRNRFMIPAGGYREPWTPGRNRAGAVLPNESFQIYQMPIVWMDMSGKEVPSPPEATLLCAIGRPERFRYTAEAQGVKVVDGRFLADHDPLDQPDLFNLFDANLPIITTSKDWVKLMRRNDLAGRNILIAKHEIKVEPANVFQKLLVSNILDKGDA